MDLIFPFHESHLLTNLKTNDCRIGFNDFGNGKAIVKSLVIAGSSNCCKTSLLMQAAITEANNGSEVLFVSPQKLSKLPASIHGLKQPSSQAMKNINFLYAKNSIELQGYLSSLHLKPDKPSTIVVDNLDYYCTSDYADSLGELASFSKLSSLVREATAFPLHSNVKGNDSCNEVKRGYAIMSWNTGGKSSVTLSDLEYVSKKDNQQLFVIRVEGTKNCFEMKSKLGVGILSVSFVLRTVNPNTQLIYLKDIFLQKNST